MSAFSFVPVFLWQDFFRFEFRLMDEALCVFASDAAGMFLYLPPLGTNASRELYVQCFDYMEAHNQVNNVTRIENALFPMRSRLSGPFRFREKTREYYYSVDDIAEYKGKRYKTQRGLCNVFVKNYAFQVLPYVPSMRAECQGLLQAWTRRKAAQNKGAVFDQMLKDNLRVHALALRYDAPLGLKGLVVKVGDAIKGVTLGFPLSSGIFCVMSEVTDLTLKGLACFIFREFARVIRSNGYTLINAMDAWGLDNVARTKQHFHPVMMMPSFTITKKG